MKSARIHRGNNQVITARFGAALRIGDKSGDGFASRNISTTGERNEIVLAPSMLRLLDL